MNNKLKNNNYLIQRDAVELTFFLFIVDFYFLVNEDLLIVFF